MKRGPKGIGTPVDYVGKVESAWAPEPPPWVRMLAEEAQKGGARRVADRLGYSGSVISQVLSRTYRGDYGGVETAVRGAFMGETVDCPVLGEVGTDRCRAESREPFRATSAMRAQLWHACRTCSNREVPS